MILFVGRSQSIHPMVSFSTENNIVRCPLQACVSCWIFLSWSKPSTCFNVVLIIFLDVIFAVMLELVFWSMKAWNYKKGYSEANILKPFSLFDFKAMLNMFSFRFSIWILCWNSFWFFAAVMLDLSDASAIERVWSKI